MEITEAEGEVGNEFTLSDFKQVKGFTAYEMRDWEWFGEANSSGKVSFENYKSDDMITGFPKKCAFDKLQSVELAVKITLILYHWDSDNITTISPLGTKSLFTQGRKPRTHIKCKSLFFKATSGFSCCNIAGLQNRRNKIGDSLANPYIQKEAGVKS